MPPACTVGLLPPPWGQAQWHSAHSACKRAGRLSPSTQSAHSSFPTASHKSPQLLQSFLSSKTYLCLVQLPSCWLLEIGVPQHSLIYSQKCQSTFTVKTVRLAPLQNSRQTLPPYLASMLLANWAQSGEP